MVTPGNCGKPVTIYDVAGLAGEAFIKAMTPQNIMKGFKASGLVPLNDNIFTEDEFLSSAVTDRPMTQSDFGGDDGSSTSATLEPVQSRGQPSTSQSTVQQATSPQVTSNKTQLSTAIITPEAIRPHPKAEARKKSDKGRAKGKSRVLTDTPEKLAIEAEKNKKCTKRGAPKPNLSIKEKNTRQFKKDCLGSLLMMTEVQKPTMKVTFRLETVISISLMNLNRWMMNSISKEVIYKKETMY